MLSIITGVFELITGKNAPRLLVTALISGAMAATATWQVQNWRWKANTAAQDADRAADSLARAKMLDDKRVLVAGNTTKAEEIYEAKLKQAQRAVDRSASVNAGLARVLDTAGACARQGVRDGQSTGSYDAADTRWQLVRRVSGAD